MKGKVKVSMRKTRMRVTKDRKEVIFLYYSHSMDFNQFSKKTSKYVSISGSCKQILGAAEAILEKVNDQTIKIGNYVESLQREQRALIDENWRGNKVRQFNSIRKYLNPTMAALLRMQMFKDDQAEYQYRTDEKQLSKELLSLNPAVYRFMKNEWRFSLPPEETVESWIHNDDTNDELM